MDVVTLDLGRVTLPDWHPLAATDGFAIVRGFAIGHPDGVILFDTGVADDHELLNEMYQPTVVPIVDAVNRAGFDGPCKDSKYSSARLTPSQSYPLRRF